jgi:hypothetical protein
VGGWLIEEYSRVDYDQCTIKKQSRRLTYEADEATTRMAAAMTAMKKKRMARI